MITFQDRLAAAPIGAILVSYGDGAPPKGITGKLLQTAYDGIRRHQRALYPGSPRADGVHIQIKIAHGGLAGQWVSAEVPKVKEHDKPVEPGRKYRLYRYVCEFPYAAIPPLQDYARALVGRPYDLLQLVGIAAGQQKWIPKFMRRWLSTRLQLPGRKEVCSTLAHRALLAAWEAAQNLPALPNGPFGANGQGRAQTAPQAFPRPLEGIDPFDACPADFEHSPSFHLIAESLS